MQGGVRRRQGSHRGRAQLPGAASGRGWEAVAGGGSAVGPRRGRDFASGAAAGGPRIPDKLGG